MYLKECWHFYNCISVRTAILKQTQKSGILNTCIDGLKPWHEIKKASINYLPKGLYYLFFLIKKRDWVMLAHQLSLNYFCQLLTIPTQWLDYYTGHLEVGKWMLVEITNQKIKFESPPRLLIKLHLVKCKTILKKKLKILKTHLIH